jgi:hypothetical protein
MRIASAYQPRNRVGDLAARDRRPPGSSRLARTLALGAVLAVVLSGLVAQSAQALPEIGRCVAKPGTGRYADSNCQVKAGGAPSEKGFEFVKGAAGLNFVSAGGASVLESVSGAKLECETQSATGRYDLDTAVINAVENVVVSLHGCSIPALSATCNTAGRPTGEIVTSSLAGGLGYVNKAKAEAGLELKPAALKAPFATFQCGGSINVSVAEGLGKGGNCVIAPVTPADTMALSLQTLYSQSKGTQQPAHFDGSARVCNLEVAFNGGKAERAGEALQATITNEEALELRARASEEGKGEECAADPSILLYPNNTKVVVGERATFAAEASTPPHCAEPSAQWYRIPPGSETQEAIAGATAASYTTEPTVLSESGTRYVVCFTNVHSTTCANEGKKVGWTLTVTETSSPCATATAEMPTFNSEGAVVVPAGAEDVTAPVETEESQGPVSKLFPALETKLDTWYPKAHCEWSIGGTVPAEALPGGAEEEAAANRLKELEITANPKEVQTKLGEIGGELATTATELPAGTQLPQLCPKNTKEKSELECTPSTVGAPELDQSKPFSGRDIIFVHGLELDPFSKELKAAEHSGATLPTWPAEPAAFHDGGYWKELANQYWSPHIERWLRGKYPGGTPSPFPTNRYLTIAWPSTQRLAVGANVMLAQIRDAMVSGRDVRNQAEPLATKGFCHRGCVIISQSTGGELADVAMSLATTTRWGNLKFIPEHVRAQVAEHDAFSGSGLATAAVALGNELPAIAAVCHLAIEVLNVLTEFQFEGNKCKGLARVAEVIPRSVLVDLVPAISQGLWGKTIGNMPVATLTTAGGHPTANGIDKATGSSLAFTLIDKLLLLPGLDDGVLTMNSQCANPEPAITWPSGFTPRSFFRGGNVFDMGVPLHRGIGFFLAQVVDPRIASPGPVAGACTPYVSPDGMVEPWSSGISPLKRYKNHYSFLQDVSDHYIGPLNFEAPFGETACYLDTDPLLWPSHNCGKPGHGDNSELVRVITNPVVYAPPTGCPVSGGGPGCASLVNPAVQGLVEQSVRGPHFSFRIFHHTHTWWLWKRTYDLLKHSGGEWTENDYVYNYVLR